MTLPNGTEVKHSLCPDRVGVVIGGSWWPDPVTGTFLTHVFWNSEDRTMIRPELLEELPHGTLDFDFTAIDMEMQNG